ncbi:hypothetical protein [Chryseobacterium sp. NFX27]|uniref:hypothetical protein n=1 Tax=Chryseobacterium sp. NFX27 TaxID=2819618 RepID=UPI003CFB49C1
MENKAEIILAKIEDLKKQKTELSEIDEMEVPESPREQLIYTLQEYSDYIEKKEEMIRVQKLKHYAKEEGVIIKNRLEDEIMKLLPEANTWFKIGNYVLGYETNDWPSSRDRLLIVPSYEMHTLTSLRHQIIN